MKFFTKAIVLALLFGLVVTALSGCGGKTPEPTSTAGDPGQTTARPADDSGKKPTRPTDDPEATSRQIGDYVECETTKTDFGIIEIPQFSSLMPQSDSTEEANQAFAQVRDMLLAEIEDYQSYGGTPDEEVDYFRKPLCSYRAAFCGDIVSVILEYEDFNTPGNVYLSYHLDAENGASPVETADVIQACGVSEDTIAESIRYYGEKVMSQEWEQQLFWSFANDRAPIDGVGDPSMGFVDALDDMVAMSLEDPLVYADGQQLYIVAHYPTEAGAGRYCKLIAVSDDPYVIDYLSPETPFGEAFRSAITESGATELVQHYLDGTSTLPAGLQFEVESLMPMEVDYYSEPCYELHAFYDEGDHISTAGRYAVGCFSGTLYEYDPAVDAYSLCPDGTAVIDCEPVTKALAAGALMSVYNAPSEYELWAQPKVREIDLVYEQTGDRYWFYPEAESMFVFVAEDGLLYGANVTVSGNGAVRYSSEDRICATQVKAGDAILFHAVRPEGQPSQAIVFESASHGNAVYPLHFDGMNGTQPLELIKAE